MADRKIAGFKKFSDMKAPKIEEFNPALDFNPDTDADLPMNPNLPGNSKKIEKPASREKLMPKKQDINLVSDEDDWYDEKDEEIEEDSKVEENVKTYGKVAKFPRNTKASKAFNFLESVKTSKKNIWYMLIEQQDSELQMVKYNNAEGVDVNKFINELKSYYISQNKGNKLMCEALSKIGVEGNSNLSRITNIPKIKINNKLVITKITEDLIKLLSK
jgi:hypothetical protein